MTPSHTGTAETNKSLILGDAFNSVTTFDGDDLIDITLSGVDASSNTIKVLQALTQSVSNRQLLLRPTSPLTLSTLARK